MLDPIIISYELTTCQLLLPWNTTISCEIQLTIIYFKVNSNIIELIVHTSCYCILDLLCVTIYSLNYIFFNILIVV